MQLNYRINQGYCQGTGDRGTSSFQVKSRQTKDSDLAKVYNQIDHLQALVSSLLAHHYFSQRLQQHFLIKMFHLQGFFSPLLESEGVFCLEYLEQALPAIAANFYLEGANTKYRVDSKFLEYLNQRIQEWQSSSASQEFQVFSTSPNLSKLNLIRVEIRRLESLVVEWDKDVEYSLTRILLNRLSTFFWAFLGREREHLKLKRSFWIGRMPRL